MTEESSPRTLEFHYIKSNSFRVVHADGVWGGPTPRGYVTMSFFSERPPIPRRIAHELKPSEGHPRAFTLGKELATDGKEGFVREVEVEITVDLAMAKSLVPWLQSKIELLEAQNEAHSEAEK